MPLSKLNAEQFAAATAPLGYNLVIASAGTGKTSTIVARIAHLLQNGVKPDKILLLTFTNKASKEMIERLQRHFDKKITSEIMAGTFHASAYVLLKKIDQRLVLKPSSELKALLKSVYEKRTFYHLSELKPYTPSFLYDIYTLFQSKAKQGGFGEFIKEYYEEHGVYAEIYEDIFYEFEEEKKRFSYMDFNDLLLYLKEHLAQNELHFDEILVDEYQDTNALQTQLIEGFKAKSLFCVGDYDQSIYAFNGADISIIANFAKRYEGARIFSLNKNYRSNAYILALANKVILNNERLYPKELIVTRQGEFKRPQLFIFNESFEQYKHLAEFIARSGVEPSEIAVIFRNNSSADGMEIALREQGIKSVLKGSRSFFESLEIKAFCAMMSLCINPKDIMAFIHLLSYLKGVGAAFAKDIFDAFLKLGDENLIKGFLEPNLNVSLAKKARKSYELGLFEDLEIITNSHSFELESEFKHNPVLNLPKMNEYVALNLEFLYKFLKEARQCDTSLELVNLILENEFFVQICDFLATKRATNKAGHIDTARKNESLEKMQSKFALLQEFAKDYKDKFSYYNFLTLGASELDKGKGVNLLSIHASKGLEFKMVFVIDLAQNRFPNTKLMAMGGSLEEERRLFYVALTRAKDELYLSYARYDNAKKQHYKPSCFLIEAGLCKAE